MLLKEILTNIPHTTNTTEDSQVLKLARDSRQVEEGSLFFAIAGAEDDGHKYAKQALENGALAVVVERDLGLEKQIIVESTHYAYAIASGNFYGNPADKLKLLGVTGTNGKTTITYITKGILESAGKKVGLIGTIENIIGDVSLQARHTTPDPYQLHALLARMAEAGCEYVVMEVSSHAMDQQRLAGCNFEAAGFTNLTQDHLDYHGNMENYYQAKKKIFDSSKLAVVNVDDRNYGTRLERELETDIITVSTQGNMADLSGCNIRYSQTGSTFELCYNEMATETSFVQPGEFSVSNALVAAGLCLGAGLTYDEIAQGIKNCPSIPGRFEIIPTNTNFTVIRDFAHSPDGLEQLLSSVRSFVEGRIITLFGCAGERDRSKRKLMAEAAARYSDVCILTADNPRSEPVEQTIKDAVIGFEGYTTPYHVFNDRFDGIVWALRNSRPGDYLILAGKGHEDYQVLDYGTINFNEKEIVLSLVNN